FYIFRAVYLAFFGEERWRQALVTPGVAPVVAPAAGGGVVAAGLSARETTAHHGAATPEVDSEHVAPRLEPESARPAPAGAPAAGGQGAHDAHDDHAVHEPHESPWIMVIPLLVLAIPAAFAGWLNIPGLITSFGDVIFFEEIHHSEINFVVAV